MTRYLSADWLAAADAAVGDDAALQSAGGALGLVIDQTVTREGDDPIRYHVAFAGGSVRIVEGPAPTADVRYTQSYEVAAAIASGAESAQMAFMRGDLTVGGDVRALMAHRPVLERFADVLGELRADTTFDRALDEAGG